MKRTVLLPLALLLLANLAPADDQLRNVQTELKSLGFYYGEIHGQASPETTAAIRRYQIRNGLEVTGALDQETLKAMGVESGKNDATKPPAAPPAAVEKKTPPVNLRRNEAVEESDRNFLREEANQRPPNTPVPSSPRDPSIINPPAPLDAPSADFPVLFAGTPYATAPGEVQRQTLRKAQALLAGRGHYRDVVDGLPGPATEEALLSYQRAQRLVLTGRLDLETLSQLRLLPTAGDHSRAAGSRPPERAYRGIWINRGGLRFGVEFD